MICIIDSKTISAILICIIKNYHCNKKITISYFETLKINALNSFQCIERRRRQEYQTLK
jgi:hypothetical protein